MYQLLGHLNNSVNQYMSHDQHIKIQSMYEEKIFSKFKLGQ